MGHPFWFALLISITQANNDCNEAYNCAGMLIKGNSTETINCYGSFSCTNASIETQDNDIICGGSHSCYNTKSITNNSTSARGDASQLVINCAGLYSCANSHNISSVYKLDCFGEKSCVNSITAARYWNLYGARSGENSIGLLSNPYGQPCRGDLYGHLAGLNSFLSIDDTCTDSSSSEHWHFYGTLSGHNATLTCFNIDCHIVCQANGCHGLSINASENSSILLTVTKLSRATFALMVCDCVFVFFVVLHVNIICFNSVLIVALMNCAKLIIIIYKPKKIIIYIYF